MTDTPPHPAPGLTFRDWLATLTADQLATTLRLRPDAVLPIPPGIGPLAARLQLRASVARAVRRLNALQLAVLEAAADLGAQLQPVPSEQVVAAVRTRAEAVPPVALIEQAVTDLYSYAIFYGRQVSLITEATAVLPADWQLLSHATDTRLSVTGAIDVLRDLPEAQRKVLDTLVTSDGRGLTRDADPAADPARPIPQLISAGLLTRIDAQTVALPLLVRRAMRGETTPMFPLLPSARFGETTPDAGAVTKADQSGAAAGLEVARSLRQLIELLGSAPVALLKDGDVGVRAITKLARELDREEAEVIRLVSLGVAAGLLGRGEPVPHPAAEDEGVSYLAPTPAADEWLTAELGQRWSVLLRGWWSSPWQSWLVGVADPQGQTHRLLSAAVRHDGLPETRRLVLEQSTRPAPGTAVTDEEVLADLRFAVPLAATRIGERTVSQLLAQARWVGALAGDTATSALRTLFNDGDVAEVADQVMPPSVDKLIVQADMTVLAPGPLPRELQQEVELLAQLESAGLASVYRITETSIRTALDTGRTAAELKEFLTTHSLGEVPQSIPYLIDDVARRHGSLRGGPALSYLRCDDESLLRQAVGSPAAELVGLRLIAPTVAIAQSPLARVIEALRATGFQPVAEDATGASLDIRPTPSRVTVRDKTRRTPGPLDESRIRAAVATILRTEGGQPDTAPSEDPLSLLQAAARAGKTVTLGIVDKQGAAVRRVVRPLRVGGGQVDAVDPATGSAHRFTLHRITEVIVD